MNNYLDLISKDLQNFPQSNSENLDLIQSKKILLIVSNANLLTI